MVPVEERPRPARAIDGIEHLGPIGVVGIEHGATFSIITAQRVQRPDDAGSQ